MKNPIHEIYNTTILFQITALFFFIVNVIENNVNEKIKLLFKFSNTYSIEREVEFSEAGILIAIGVIIALIIASSVQIYLAGGLSDSGTLTIRLTLVFVFKFAVLLIPILWIVGKSDFFIEFQALITFMLFLIHVFELMNSLKNEGEN